MASENLKTGRLSYEEQEFIRENKDKMSINDMAKELSRRMLSIRSFVNKLPRKELKEKTEGLESTPMWESLKAQLTDIELSMFAEEYTRYIEQFKNDVLHTEMVQICDSIKSGILANRCLEQMKYIADGVKDVQKQIARAQNEDMSNVDSFLALEGQNAALLGAHEAASKEYQNYIKMKNDAFKSLKATRDQRYAKVESARTSFVNWMKLLLEDDVTREKIRVYIEKSRIAMEREKRRLAVPFKYDDDEYDIPFLNHETVMQDYEELNEVEEVDGN